MYKGRCAKVALTSNSSGGKGKNVRGKKVVQAVHEKTPMIKQILIFFSLPFQNDADLIVSYSTYQAETTAITTGPGRGVGQAVGSGGVGSASGGVISASSSGQRRIIATSSGSTRHPGPGGAAIGKFPHHYRVVLLCELNSFFYLNWTKQKYARMQGQTLWCIVSTRYE